MMQFLRRLYRFLFPKRWRTVPRKVISPYQMGAATEQERLLMRLGLARNPQNARALMRHYRVKTASEVLQRLPPKKRNLKKRLWLLIQRWDGHQAGNPYITHPQEDRIIQVRYRYRRTSDENRPHSPY